MAVLACPLRANALERPDAFALIVNQEPVSYALLDSWVEQYRLVLVNEGLKEGDRLLVLAENPVKIIVSLLACLRSRWVFCPLNPAFPATKIADYCVRISARHLLCTSPEMVLPEELIAHKGPLLEPDRSLQPGKSIDLDLTIVCDLVATSGTTGTPKAVAHSLGNHIASARASQAKIPLNTEDSWLLSLPLFHVGGLGVIYRCLLHGARMVIDTRKKPLDDILVNQKVTHVSLVNTQLYRLLRSDPFDLRETSLKCILLGGGVAIPTLVRKVQDAGVRILTTYGMTEMSSQVCTGEPEFIGSGVTSGEVLPHCEVTIGSSGEILVCGQSLCLGYFYQGAVRSVSDKSGWYHTGDKGEWVGNQLKVTGRLDNMFISGGENIHPEEIEQALLSIEGVEQAVVVAGHDEKFGQRPFAFIQYSEGEFEEDVIKQRLKPWLPRFKIPDSIKLLPPSVFRNTLKPDRQYLQELINKQTVQ
ncbi:MAG: o-succinylbenzoate--CoA ligase [Endozoicomonas sp.]